MGFSYGYFGLCCDFCDKDDPQLNVKKIPCPFGYCQDWAVCKNCHAKGLHNQSSCRPEKIQHKDFCKQASIDFDKKQSEVIVN